MSFYSVVHIFFSSTLLPSSDQSLNSPPASYSLSSLTCLPLLPLVFLLLPVLVLLTFSLFYPSLYSPSKFLIFCVFHNIHLCIIHLYRSHKNVRLYNLLTQQCEIRKEKRKDIHRPVDISALSHSSSSLSPQGWEESCDAAVSHLLRSCLSRSPKDQATSLAQTGGPMLGLPRDTARLKKHITLLCDRIGKGGRLTLVSEANVQVPAQVQNLAAPGESMRERGR